MNTCVALKWLPDTLPARVQAALRGVLEHWAREWGAPACGSVSARILGAHESPAASLPDPLGEPPQAWSGALARALLGRAAPASAIAQGATLGATADLQKALRQRFQVEPSRPFVAARIGHGGVELGFELLGTQFGFALDIAALQTGNWLAAQPPPSLKAVALEQALHDVPVPLTAQLGHAQISVTDILQLTPGDILLLNETLDAPLQITSPGSPFRLTAHLGAAAASSTTPALRAMRWLAS